MLECSPVSTNVMLQSLASVQLDLAAAAPHGEIVGQALVVVAEVLANHVAAIAESQHEILVAVVSVVAHQVPHDRPVSDAHQRLRYGIGVLAQTRA
jgi:hypothetical protein